MERVRKVRTITRSSFTRLYNRILDSINVPEAIEDLQSKFETLKTKFDELQELDRQIMDLMVDGEFSNEEIEEESISSDDYSNSFYKVRALLAKRSSKEDCIESNVSVSSADCNKRKFKLPLIELKQFDGNTKNWLPFWSQFKRIDEDENIELSDKFQYLIQSTVPNSRARELIESYPATAENYAKALDSLKTRFGRDDLLIELYIRELLSLVIKNAGPGTSCSITVLYDVLETHLRCLETLGVVTATYDAMLFPLVESCIPEDLLRVWQRQYTDGMPEDRLNKLMKFLRNEVESEERISMAMAGFDFKRNKPGRDKKKTSFESFKKEEIPTAAGLFTTQEKTVNVCVFCEGKHTSSECYKAASMSYDQKKTIISKKRCCFCCLKHGHTAKNCKAAIRCLVCQRRHMVIIYPDLSRNQETRSKGDKKSSCSGNESETVEEKVLSSDVLHSGCCSSPEVLLQTLVVKLEGKKRKRNIRAVIDTGSQRSYILKSSVIEAGFEAINEELIIHSLFGGQRTKACKHKSYRIDLASLDGNYACNLGVLDQETICGEIPRIKNGSWIKELKSNHIVLSDFKNEPGPIEVLIGADVAGKLFTGKHIALKNGLVAMETKLGSTLLGKVPGDQANTKVSMTVTSMFSQDGNSLSHLWDLEVIGIRDPIEQKSKEETKQAVCQHFQETVTTKEDGKYEVHLPWKVSHPPLSDNYDLALKRLDSTCKKLEKDSCRTGYQQSFYDWLAEGIIEKLSVSEVLRSGHYLPHRHVLKENSTTKIRPVFDASSKTAGNPSLNSCLEKGINLIECIPSILNRFRLETIGVIADIRKAFLQISLNERDRDFLRFLWFDEEGKLQVYRHTRVVFGVTSSPFLLGAVIDHHLAKELQLTDQKSMVEKLRNSFYVDNCVTSVEDESVLKAFIEEATNVMKKGQFDLRGWEHTCLIPSDEKAHKSNVLGLIWDKSSDSLEISSECLRHDELETVTKRKMLSIINKLFDPIGFTCPVLLVPKVLLQSTWKTKESWDADVNEDVKQAFMRWVKDLPYLGDIKVPRWFGESRETRVSLHTFCDASQIAYAAAVFIRCESESHVTVQLVQARSRITPMKKITIPRLELLAATIGSRLYVSVVKALKCDGVESFFWTDSTTVLAWIQREEQWSVFVSNRVKEIRQLTSPKNWNHVPGDINPADLPSRGCGAKQLLESQWWEGPMWLKEHPSSWPKSPIQVNEEEVVTEFKKSVKSMIALRNEPQDWYYTYFSKYESIVRMIGWILRFRKNAQIPRVQHIRGNLTVEEYCAAECKVIQLIQQEAFLGDKDPKLRSLYPYIDENGTIRLKTKISHREDVSDFRLPAVLPNHKHPVVFRMIMDIHQKSSHAGVQMMRTILRERFWILGGCHTIRAVINTCQTCKRYKVERAEAVPGPLPGNRVRDAKVFEVTGVDLAGPLYLRDGENKSHKKAWVCLFTCGVYRAVHLELVSSLSTDNFLQGFRRFIRRRGRPSIVYCDNGTNFVGAANALDKIDWEKIKSLGTAQKICWKFNPPSAPWWGGWWERMIGLLKQLLRRVLGRASLNFEEMQTILCDCESIINSRPLTYVFENPNDLEPLTPDMFLKDIDEVGVPDFNLIEAKDLNKRLKYRNRLREELQRRFRCEYLGHLKMRMCKEHLRKLTVGEVVLIGCDNKKRVDWPLAKVEELLPGRDGKVRVVRLKTASGSLIRPIQRVFPLEISTPEDVNVVKSLKKFNSTKEVKRTCTGRRVKLPIRYPEGL